jgi:regulator of protease activity HflC (stomatin/prohibitin superfamily)
MNKEIEKKAADGWSFLIINILLYVFGTVFVILGVKAESPVVIIASVLELIASSLISNGFMVLQPNEAGALLLLGKYKGTVKQEGFLWVNPFYSKRKISLRMRTLNGEKLKVNDKAGNPIEIAAVIVWGVENTFAAMFEVENYTAYVNTQSESALRHLASAYPYDCWEDEKGVSLRGHIDEVSAALEKELEQRLSKAGVRVMEARLSHLAYAAEIAESMLRRQQATAIVAARQKIVEGAVGMVRTALEMLKTENVVEMDEERKAAMVGNLLVVLCGESHAQPIVNAGTLYH